MGKFDMAEYQREYQRTYRQKNREKVREKARAYNAVWYPQNKERRRITRRAYFRDYYRHRRQHDPQYAMKHRLQNRMWAAVKKAGLKKKCDSTSKLLGISYQGLEEWMSSQFTEGMSWENRSEWHIDHRIPCDAFDLTVPEQQRICFWYKNLQPLWGPENMSKSNKYDEADKQALIAEYYKERI